MDLIADFKTYQERVTSSLVNVTKTSSQLSNQDLSFHRSANEKLSRALDIQNAHLLRLTNKLLKAAIKETNIKPPNLEDQEGIDDNWRRIVDVVDDLLEKADASLDEFTGAIRRQSPAARPETPERTSRPSPSSNVWTKNQVQKPQQFFTRPVNNHETVPWKPILKAKPHAVITLEESIGSEKEGQVGQLYKHPYAYEIEHQEYPKSVYQKSVPISYSPPNETQPIFVETEEAVQAMLEELKQAKEIAIDLEHHDRRSYIGMVCLMQISTRDKDWIVDTLKPWRENLQILNDVFADPNIIKVFHGSSMDMIWLQRDLGLYVVGLFDTYYACVELQFPGRGLKYLLQRFANFQAQKQYQTADWRIRPLPTELLDYARSDTHYLLYIYDNLRNMLIEASTPGENLLDRVLAGSRSEALQVYQRPIYDRDFGLGVAGWFGLLMQRQNTFDKEQFGVFRALHQWRDEKAREWDEGLQFIMSNSVLWTLAEHMPIYMANLYQYCRPVPKMIADNAKEIIEVVKKGKDEGRGGPTINEIIQQNEGKPGAFIRRWRKEKEKPETTFSGVGATLQQLSQSGKVDVPTVAETTHSESVKPQVTRSLTSSLWGEVLPKYTAITPVDSMALGALKSVLPLPPVGGREFTDSTQLAILTTPSATREKTIESVAVHSSPIPNGIATSKADSKDVFTLKEMSRKRNADEALDRSPGMHEESVPLTEVALENLRHEKEQRKAEKRARKEAATRVAPPTVPFDYAGADSLLQPKRDQQDNKENAKSKPMNPFAKALDTKTGAKRSKMGKELAGRSHTFQQ